MVTWKCLAGLVFADHLADLDSDRPGASEPSSLDAGDDRGQQLLGRLEQVLALAGAVGGQHRVAAGDQPLAWEVRAGDLGQVLLVEEAELERAVVGYQLLDGRGAQRGDPAVGIGAGGCRPPVWFNAAIRAEVIMPRSPTMTMSRQPERLPYHLDDLGEGGRVAGVAGEHPDRDRAAFRVGEQPVLDLQLAFLAVPGVAAGGQRAVRAFQPRAGQVEQSHPRRVRGRGQVPAGQSGLDRVLPGRPASPSRRRCHRWMRRPRPGRRPGSYQPARSRWTAWRPRPTTREMISARARSRCAARRAQQRGQAQLDGHRVRRRRRGRAARTG